MDRNPDQRTREVERYARSNPPVSEDDAQEKLDKLNNDISLIEVDLEHKKVESFVDVPAYEVWRKRAISALGHIKSEIRFLESWLGKCESEKKKVLRGEGIREVKERVDLISVEIRQWISLGMDTQHPPRTLDDAKQRIAPLSELGKKVEAVFMTMKTIGVTKTEVYDERNQLRELSHILSTHRKSVEGYIRLHDPDARAPEDDPLSDAAQKIVRRASILAEEVTQEHEDFFRAQNPPGSLEEGRQRLQEVEPIRLKIQRALSEVNAAWQDHPYTGGTLKVVKRPLVDLLAFVGIQDDYLRRFIERMERDTKYTRDKERQGIQSTLDQISCEIREQAVGLANAIAAEYAPRYTAEQPPGTLEEAQQRRTLLVETKARLIAALAQITDAWTSHPLRREDLPSIKRPLTTVLDAVESEIRLVNKSLTNRGGGGVAPMHVRWKAVCVAALTRAMMGGFKLTADEQAVVQEILEELAARSTAAS